MRFIYFSLLPGLFLLGILFVFYLFDVKHRPLLGKMLKELSIAFVVWAIGVFIMIQLVSPPLLSLIFFFWLILLPFGYFLYLINLYWLIPEFDKKGGKLKSYILRLILATFILSPYFLTGNIGLGLGLDKYGISLHIFLDIIAMAISLTLAWFIYSRNKKQQQVFYLKKELGKSTSSLQFLRSQINPHFLFNALNTFYGMAIRENAVKTGDGIQRLGDMMRFMLKDNQKEQIPLVSEISYMKDYVYIQQLRLAESANIELTVHINEPSHEYFIAPMLLIPFVENAFKHGIRLQGKSWIRIDLYYEKDILHFEVHNSLHDKMNNDTERASTGIGLKNVKERLKLLYPDKHRLAISENKNEFIVHLALTLSP